MIYPVYINQGVRDWHKTPTPWHSNKELKIVGTIRGVFIAEALGVSYKIQASSVMVVPPNLLHRFAGVETPVEIMVMTLRGITPQLQHVICPAKRPRSVQLGARDMSLLEELHHRCLEEKFRNDAFSKHALEGLSQALFCLIARTSEKKASSHDDHRLEKAHSIIDSRFSEPLRIRNLAKLAGMSESHFRQRYQLTFGRGPKEEIIRLRIYKAQDLMRTTNWKLAEVAAKCGFCSEHEFSRIFHKRVGLAPGLWRRNG
ncbi:MAG: hypothetical protein B9S32_07370 [Verrucomicrobia bacterium Tous-C9LFEB]|nr:MAG: hypothetical protein B9S32_07370 [Verrucomicrobia bacterium Tous-C9LFEB]